MVHGKRSFHALCTIPFKQFLDGQKVYVENIVAGNVAVNGVGARYIARTVHVEFDVVVAARDHKHTPQLAFGNDQVNRGFDFRTIQHSGDLPFAAQLFDFFSGYFTHSGV